MIIYWLLFGWSFTFEEKLEAKRHRSVYFVESSKGVNRNSAFILTVGVHFVLPGGEQGPVTMIETNGLYSQISVNCINKPCGSQTDRLENLKVSTTQGSRRS